MFSKYLSAIALLFLGVIAFCGQGCSSEARKARALDRAETYFKAGEYEKARIEYMNVANLNPGSFRAMAGIGKIYFERGQILAAFPYLGTARKLDSNNVEVALDLGLGLQSISQWKKARAEALFVLGKNPSQEDALILLAETTQTAEEVKEVRNQIQELQKQAGEKAGFYLANARLAVRENDLKSAEKAVLEAYKIDPASPWVLIDMGNLSWSKNDVEQADHFFQAAAAASPIRSMRQLRLVELKLQIGAIADAKRLLENITDKAPDQVPALVYEAKIAFAEKKYENCAKLNERILALDRLNYDALVLQGRWKLASGKMADALKDLEQAKSRYPGSWEVRYYIALVHLANDNLDKAMASLGESTTVNPNYSLAVILLAELNLRKGDASSAIQLLAPLVQRQPKLSQASMLLANAYKVQERWTDVVGVYDNLIALFPKDPEPHFLKGMAFRQQGKTADARRAFLKVQEMEPTHMRALNQLVELDIAEKEYDSAWQRVEDSVALNPKSPDLQFFRAKIYTAQKELVKAEEALVKALELDATYQNAYTALAEIYFTSKKPAQALEKLRAGIAKNPKDFVSRMRMGIIFEEMKDYPNMAKAYEDLLAIDPNFAPALNNLAYLYTEYLPQNDKALALAKRAREVSNDPSLADTLGWVLYKRGEYTWALKLIQECADRITNNSEVLYHLGMAYYMTGAEAFAKANLEKAIGLKKEFRGREEAIARLDVLKTDLSKPPSEVIASLQSVLSRYPKDLIVLMWLGSAHERAGEMEKARSAYEKALEINPKCVSAMVKLSQLYAERFQNQQKALELAKNARNLAPDDPHVVEMFGPMVYKARDYPWALTFLQESDQKHPGEPVTLYYLGLCYFNLGKISEAERSIQDALRLAPGFSQADAARQILSFLSFYSHPDKTSLSEDTINSALKEDPSFAPALFASALLQERNGKFVEAQQIYERILARNPQFAPAAKQLGVLFAGPLKDDQRATELLNKAREILIDDVEIARSLGILAYKRGDYTWSEHLLKQTVDSESRTNASSLYYLGMARFHLKQKIASKEALHRALSLNDRDDLAVEARRILGELQ
jgi:tetratricopeptide (TPR) repeat protein